jgi:hypothetical protein
LRYDKGVQAQHVETLIDLRRRQPRIKGNCDAAAGYCHDCENRLGALRHEHPDPGVAIESCRTKLQADIVQLELKIVVRQRRKRGRDYRRLVWKPTGNATDDLAQRELGLRDRAVTGGRALGADHASRLLVLQEQFTNPSQLLCAETKRFHCNGEEAHRLN